jgi:hypothetical protein
VKARGEELAERERRRWSSRKPLPPVLTNILALQVASLAVDALGNAVEGEFTAPIALASMVKSSDARLGLPGHAAPLRVHVPHFDVRSIGQSTPLAAASNMLTVTLQANCDFPPATSITLAGLNSTQGAADNALAVAESTDGSIAGGTGAWDPDVGTLVLSVGDNGWSLATTYVLSFWVQNSATANNGAKACTRLTSVRSFCFS